MLNKLWNGLLSWSSNSISKHILASKFADMGSFVLWRSIGPTSHRNNAELSTIVNETLCKLKHNSTLQLDWLSSCPFSLRISNEYQSTSWDLLFDVLSNFRFLSSGNSHNHKRTSSHHIEGLNPHSE
jgi:hypothetical protein